MPDLKTHYDRYLLAAAGLLAAAIAALLVFASGAAREVADVPAPPVRKEPFAPNEAVETLRADRAAMDAKRDWRESESGASPFVSRVYLLKDGRLVDILEAGNDLFPGIPNAWILEHELDYLDTGLPEKDPDADGFTNFEEFTAKTNPRDSKSKPAEWTKLRLVGSKIDKLRFKFESLPRGSLEFVAINTISPDNPTELSGSTQIYPRSREVVRTANGDATVDKRTILLAERAADGREVLQPTPFIFERAEMRKRFNPATNVEEDVPVVFIKNTADGKLVELSRGEVKHSPYAQATLLDTRPGGQTLEVISGQTFPFGESGQYKLVDVSVEKATIEDSATKEQHSVPRASPPPVEPSNPQEEQPQ